MEQEKHESDRPPGPTDDKASPALSKEAHLSMHRLYWVRELKKAVEYQLKGEMFYSVFVDILVNGYQPKVNLYDREHVFDTLDVISLSAKQLTDEE